MSIWLLHAVCVQVVAVWLIPRLAAFAISTFIVDLKPAFQSAAESGMLLTRRLAGLAVWIGALLYATFARSRLAARLRIVWQGAGGAG